MTKAERQGGRELDRDRERETERNRERETEIKLSNEQVDFGSIF